MPLVHDHHVQVVQKAPMGPNCQSNGLQTHVLSCQSAHNKCNEIADKPVNTKELVKVGYHGFRWPWDKHHSVSYALTTSGPDGVRVFLTLDERHTKRPDDKARELCHLLVDKCCGYGILANSSVMFSSTIPLRVGEVGSVQVLGAYKLPKES